MKPIRAGQTSGVVSTRLAVGDLNKLDTILAVEEMSCAKWVRIILHAAVEDAYGQLVDRQVKPWN